MTEKFVPYSAEPGDLEIPVAVDCMICLIQASGGEMRMGLKNICLSALYSGALCDLSFLIECVSNEFDIVVSFLRYLSCLSINNELDDSLKLKIKQLVESAC